MRLEDAEVGVAEADLQRGADDYRRARGAEAYSRVTPYAAAEVGRVRCTCVAATERSQIQSSRLSVLRGMYLGTQYTAVSPANTVGNPSAVRVLVMPQLGPTTKPAGQMAGE